MEGYLNGKTLLITGSSRGIGKATAELAKEYGARVILHGKSETENLKEISKKLGSEYIYCDVTNEEEVNKAVSGIEGKIDALINSAGLQISKPFEDLTPKDFIDVYSVNVIGPVNFSKAVLPKMKEQKNGSIINISSVKGYEGTAGRAAYSASKGALNILTSSMAKELAEYNIRVNGVAPGFTDTDMTESTMSTRVKGHVESSLMKRLGKASEIAETILFLASDKSSFITGQTHIVDGGFSLSI